MNNIVMSLIMVIFIIAVFSENLQMAIIGSAILISFSILSKKEKGNK